MGGTVVGMPNELGQRLAWVVPALVGVLAIGAFFLYLRLGGTGHAGIGGAGILSGFLLVGYVALRRTFGQPAVVCLAVMAGIALHPVFALSGPIGLTGALAGVLALVASLAIVWAERQNRPGDWIAVAVPVAGAIFVNSSAWPLLIATVTGLLVHGRRREAAVVGAGTAILLVPGVLWAASRANALLDGMPIIHGGNFVPSLIRTFGLALPGWFLPSAFLWGYPLKEVSSWPLVLVGLSISGLIAVALYRAWKAANLAGRILCLHAGLTVLVAGTLSAATPDSGVGLPARMLLPVAPILLIGLWMWKATEESLERAVWERIRPYVAVVWIAGALISAPFLLEAY